MAQGRPLTKAVPLSIRQQRFVLGISVVLRVKTDVVLSTATFKQAQRSRFQELSVPTILATHLDKDSKVISLPPLTLNWLNAPLKWLFCVIDNFHSARSAAARPAACLTPLPDVIAPERQENGFLRRTFRKRTNGTGRDAGGGPRAHSRRMNSRKVSATPYLQCDNIDHGRTWTKRPSMRRKYVDHTFEIGLD